MDGRYGRDRARGPRRHGGRGRGKGGGRRRDQDGHRRRRDRREDGPAGGGRRWDEQAARHDVPREVVLPGDVLSEADPTGGRGTFSESGTVYAALLGVRAVQGGRTAVVPLAGRYLPSEGDIVIGRVVDVMPAAWIIDINSPYPAIMHTDNSQWEVRYGETGRYLTVDDTVIAKVLDVDMTYRVRLGMEGWGLRKVNDGLVLEVSHSKVPRLIGKSGSMVRMLKDRTGCTIQVGQNGRVWMGGDPDMMLVVMEAIRIIEENAHVMGLTDKVEGFLDDRLDAVPGRRTVEGSGRDGGGDDIGPADPDGPTMEDD